MSTKRITAIAALVIAFLFPIFNMNAQEQTNNKPTEEGAVVLLQTSLGDIEVLLYNDTPLHRDNFLKLVKDGTYDGVLFHRVIDEFMIQTGDTNSKTAKPGDMLGSGDPGYTIPAEFRYPRRYHKYGALAAARSGDNVNPMKESSGSQFYIVTGRKFNEPQLERFAQNQLMEERQAYFRDLCTNYRDQIIEMQKADDKEGLDKLQKELIEQTEAAITKPAMTREIMDVYMNQGGTPHLDGSYTVFGEVLKGMDVVEKIQKVATDMNDRPIDDIKILSAKVISE